MKNTIWIFRWTARNLSLLVLAFILAFVIGETLAEPGMLPTGTEWIGVLFFPVGLLSGLFLAWRWERTGGWLAVGSFVAFYIWNYIESGSFPRGPWLAILTIPAAFYLVASYLERMARPDEPKVAMQN